jgi:hypothetical protein
LIAPAALSAAIALAYLLYWRRTRALGAKVS